MAASTTRPPARRNVLGVLAADLEDGVHARIGVQCALGVGGDLVHDQDRLAAVAGGHQGADDLPAGAGGADADDAVAAGGAVHELPHQG